MSRWRLILLALGVLWIVAAGAWFWRGEPDSLVGAWHHEMSDPNSHFHFYADGTCQAICPGEKRARGSWREVAIWSEVDVKPRRRLNMGGKFVEADPSYRTVYYLLDDITRNPELQTKLWNGVLKEGHGYWFSLDGTSNRLLVSVPGGLMELVGGAPWKTDLSTGWGRVTPWHRWAPHAVSAWCQGKPSPPRVAEYPRGERRFNFNTNIGYRF